MNVCALGANKKVEEKPKAKPKKQSKEVKDLKLHSDGQSGSEESSSDDDSDSDSDQSDYGQLYDKKVRGHYGQYCHTFAFVYCQPLGNVRLRFRQHFHIS